MIILAMAGVELGKSSRGQHITIPSWRKVGSTIINLSAGERGKGELVWCREEEEFTTGIHAVRSCMAFIYSAAL